MAEFKEQEEENIKLISNDGMEFIITKKEANLLEFVKIMIDVDDSEEITCNLPNIDGKCLNKVIQYCNHYINEPMTKLEKPLKYKNLSKLIQDFYTTYIDISDSELYTLMLAADYLNCKDLLDLCMASLASRMVGLTGKELRDRFNDPNDPLTPEEEAKIAEENEWCDQLPDSNL